MQLLFSPALPAKLVAALTAAVALVAAPAAAQVPRPAPRAVPQHLQPPSVEQLLGKRDARVPQPDQYIVELDAEPVARYDGGVAGLPRPRRKDRPPRRPRCRRRAGLRGAPRCPQAAVLRAVGGVEAQVEYRIALAGFAAKLTGDQAEALRKQPGVRRVTQERILQVTQSQEAPAAAGIAGSEPELLGLPGGLWKQLGGPKNAGKGVIVGVIDSGITPESPSFADRGLDARRRRGTAPARPASSSPSPRAATS